MEEFVEVIGVEHLKTVLSGLTPEEIVKPADAVFGETSCMAYKKLKVGITLIAVIRSL